ncbi:MAG: hypothetical protein ACOYYI_06570 [Chloroflexota bacterium]
MTRACKASGNTFTTAIAWDRTFADGTTAPIGEYDVVVTARDLAGSESRETAHILIPAPGITPSPLPTRQVEPAETRISQPQTTDNCPLMTDDCSLPAPTAAPQSSFITPLTPTSTRSATVSAFQSPARQAPITNSPITNHQSPAPLFGAAALTVIAAATAYALEQRRKRKEEEARQRAEAQREASRRNAAEEARKAQAYLLAQIAAQQAALEQSSSHRGEDAKIERMEEAEGAALAAAKAAKPQRDERAYQDYRAGERDAEAIAAEYQARKAVQEYRQGERAEYVSPPPACTPENIQQPKSWWQRAGEWVQQKIVQPAQQALPKVMNWVDQHQTEIAIGIGIAAGVAAIVLSGGAATPLVAAAWVAGSAAVAGGVAALGTVGLNAYFQRPLGTNVLRNLGYAAGAAAVTATVGFALQAVAPTVTRAAAQFCLGHVTTCSVAAPVFKGIDYAWTGYDVWQSQRTLKSPAANPEEKLLAAVNIGLAAWSESLEPDDALAIGLPLDDVVRKELMAKFAEILEREGREAALAYLKRVAGDIPLEKLLGKVDDDVLVYAARSGPDAVKALAGWTDDELAAHGVELALRAERDAKAIQAAEELVKLGPIAPAHLTPKQEKLLEEIARNSMQYAENGQVVIGAWKGFDDGYIQYAMETGSAYYHNHLDVWNTLKANLGDEGAQQAAWLINQKALQPYIERGAPFEYTLKGVRDIKIESKVVELIWDGKSEAEILKSIPGISSFSARWRELMELYKAGYQQTFDEIANAYILVKP